MSAILTIREVLANWPPADGTDLRDFPHDSQAGPHIRLWKALSTAWCHPGKTAPHDLASLVRHSLRHEEERTGDMVSLRVPTETSAPWPDERIWKQHGVEVRRESEHYRIRARQWNCPEWVTAIHVHRESDPHVPFGAADGVQHRRPNTQRIPLDPSLEGKFDSIGSYWSTAQAEAIRGLMLSPPGSTHLMIYPTGSGKSLMGLAASMAGRTQPSGVNIVIVPTVALALDQVEQAKLSFPSADIDAWESGTPEPARAAIRERIRNGTQTFLYTSPESLVGHLKPDLLMAAQSGFLQTLIIDEAHLISQWGSSFRPSFQSMTALWRELRAQCPLRTILMSATVTAQTFEDLKLFYDLPDAPLQVSAAIHLRAEIDSYSSRCHTPAQKRDRIFEVLRHAPRPAILYVTKVEDAKNWFSACLKHGWMRVGLLHGESSSGEKRAAISKWRNDEIDLMVATSAFGLGMDKGDVRTVIHGCVPETIDRFYQEVGRGGRDGNAAVTMMVHDPEDFDLGRKMSSASTIGDRIGLERWETMFLNSREVGGNVHDVDTDSLRPDLDYAGDRNRQWNMRTLVLLARAGVLEFRHLPPPEIKQKDGESDADFEQRREALWETYRATSRIALLKANPLSENNWSEATSGHRKSVDRHQRRSWKGMESVLNQSRRLTDVLSDIYRIPEAGIEHVPRFPNGTAPTPPEQLCRETSPALADIAARHRFITYPTAGVHGETTAVRLSGILRVLATHGIREICLPHAWRVNAWDGMPDPLAAANKASREHFIIVRTLKEDDEHANVPSVPRVTLLTPDWVDKRIPSHLFTMHRPLHLILIPEECRDPGHVDRRIGDTRADVIPIQTASDQLLS